MGEDSTLKIIVKLQDDASEQLQALSDKVKNIGEQVGQTAAGIGTKISAFGSSMQSFGHQVSSAGNSMSIGLTLPIVALGTEVINTSMKFQASMELIRTQAGATQQEVDNMTKAVLDLAKSGETGQGPEKLAEGLYHIESLGFRGAQALDMLKTSAQAADLGLANMEGVTNALGAAIVTGIKGTQTMNEAMGLLNATIGQGNMRMDDLVAALGTGILPAAKNFGLSLQDVGAALATLTDNGMRADESATRLRMTFSLMAAPTEKAKGALAEIGLSAYQLAEDMRSSGLVGAVDDLKAHLENSGKSATQQAAVLSAAFGGGRTSAAILTLVEQSDRLKTKFDAIGESAGNFQEQINATKETKLFELDQAMAKVQATMIDLGETVMPLFADALDKLSKLLEKAVAWWDKLSPTTQKWIAISLGIVAALGPVLVILGSLITAVGIITSAIGGMITFVGNAITVFTGLMAVNPIVLAIVAVVLVLAFAAYELYKHWDVVRTNLIKLWNGIKEAWDIVIAYITGGITGFQDIWTNAWTAVKDVFSGIWNGITAIVQDAFNTIMNIVNTILSAIAKVSSAAQSIVPHMSQGASLNPFSESFQLPHFETGGMVNAPRGSEVLAMVHGGEQIIPAEQVSGRGRGNNVTIVINNPSVRKDSDIAELRKQIEQMMRPILLNAKVIHI